MLKKIKYEMGNFCEQFGLPPITPSQRTRKKPNKFLRKKPAPYYTKKRKFNKPIGKTFIINQNKKILLILLKKNVLIVAKLVIFLINIPNCMVN
jgi:hypothetical protein